jgi:hypothetical protein
MLGALLPVRVQKEIRGLFPAWLACLATMVAAVALGGQMQVFGLIGFFLGAVALGALSMGHEYSSRTLSLLLTQPTRRERLFLEKLGVLSAMLLVLYAVASLGLFDSAVQWGFGNHRTRNVWGVIFGLPLLCSLFLAPWLTMVCRSALAGIVFALATPATIWILSDLVSATTYGGELAGMAEASDFTFDLFWRGMLIVFVLTAAAGWRQFMQLEAIDSRGGQIGLPSWLASGSEAVAIPASTTHRALGLLVKKELHLQQLTFAVSVLYVLGWIALVWFNTISPATRTTLLYTITVFHLGAIPILAGSLASAEERQLGTLEWQALLPMASWRQWLVKTAVAVIVALTLTLALPRVLLYFAAAPQVQSEVGPLASGTLIWGLLLVVAASLYISTLCANGLKALLIAVPTVFVLIGLISQIASGRWYLSTSAMWQRLLYAYGNSDMAAEDRLLFAYTALMTMALWLTYAVVLGLLLWFALANHRSAERGKRRVWKHMAQLAACLAVGMSLWGGAYRLYAGTTTERMKRFLAEQIKVSGVAIDGASGPAKNYTVVIFREDAAPSSARVSFVHANPRGEFEISWLRPGRYAFAAVDRLDQQAQRDPELIDRLRSKAESMTLEPGTSKTLSLTLATF